MHITAISNTSHGFWRTGFEIMSGLSGTYQVFRSHTRSLGNPHSRDSAHVIHKMIRKYRNRVIICSKWSVINCVHMTAFSNTCQDFREHARFFRNVPGISITYQAFGEHPRARDSGYVIHKNHPQMQNSLNNQWQIVSH